MQILLQSVSPVASLARAAHAAKAIGWGVELVTVSDDVRLLAAAAGASVAEARRLHEKAQAASPTRIGGH